MRTGGFSGGAHIPYNVSSFYFLPHFYGVRFIVGVDGSKAASVFQDDHKSALLGPSGVTHHSIGSRMDRTSKIARYINARMKCLFAGDGIDPFSKM